MLLWLVQKQYYKIRNSRNEKAVAAMSDLELEREKLELDVKGNKSVLFRFTT